MTTDEFLCRAIMLFMRNKLDIFVNFIKAHAALLFVALLFHRLMLLNEEEEEGPGLIGEHEPDRTGIYVGVAAHREEYLNTVNELLSSYSRKGRMHLRRHRIMTVGALVCSAGVPVIIAAQVEGWVVAAVSAIAAIMQGAQLVLRDQNLGVESHAMAVGLSQALRKYRFETGEAAPSQQQVVFKNLFKRVEALQESQGLEILSILRSATQPPSSTASDLVFEKLK